jgi:hypothetical protein
MDHNEAGVGADRWARLSEAKARAPIADAT